MDKIGQTTEQETSRDSPERAGILQSSQRGATGYFMIKSVEINNYRCFEKASLNNCQRVNVIVGDNGSGKTALLEAMFMSSGPSPEIALRLKTWRGYQTSTVSGSVTEVEDSIWGELFHNFEKQRSISITIEGSREQNRSLRINYRVRERWVAIETAGRKKEQKNRPAPVTFIWRGPDRQPKNMPVTMNAEGRITFPVIQDLPVESSYFGSNLTYMPGETVARFSALNKTFQTEEISHFLKETFSIDDLSIEIAAGTPMLFGKTEWSSAKLPIAAVSGGLNRLAPILFAMANNPKGAIFIDEIEDGFYYKKMERAGAIEVTPELTR